ncbi:unnamed protein product [Sphagnum balticum]
MSRAAGRVADVIALALSSVPSGRDSVESDYAGRSEGVAVIVGASEFQGNRNSCYVDVRGSAEGESGIGGCAGER